MIVLNIGVFLVCLAVAFLVGYIVGLIRYIVGKRKKKSE